MYEKLDLLKESLPSLSLLNFKFGADEQYDLDLIDWFADGGEIRTYTYKALSGPAFMIYLYKGEVRLSIGMISEKADYTMVKYRPVYIKRFREKNKNIAYCTSNLMETPEEIRNRPGVTAIDENTYKYKDGSFSKNNVWRLSKDNAKSIKKNEEKLISILNSL